VARLKSNGESQLDGKTAFNLYSTLGFPLEITRDILEEDGLKVDENGFYEAMEAHRLASGKGQAFGSMNGNNTEFYAAILNDLQTQGKLPENGVRYDPYSAFTTDSRLVAILKDGVMVESAQARDEVELILTDSPLYIESGGQVGDTGAVVSADAPVWKVEIASTRKPVSGLIVQAGIVTQGTPRVDAPVFVSVDIASRRATMRNHTGTHLLHAALRKVLGGKVHQSGSAVDPERMRFDFNFPRALNNDELLQIEALVNRNIAGEYPVHKRVKTLEEAKADGAMALFGEKYGNQVRTIEIADERGRVSYELCGGTHLDNTAEIGSFFITSESSVAAGIRRVEAVTGEKAYAWARERLNLLNETAAFLETSPFELLSKTEMLEDKLKALEKELENLRAQGAQAEFGKKMQNVRQVSGVPVLSAIIPNADAEALRGLTDQFRQQYASGCVVLGTVNQGKPMLIAAVTPDLIARGIKAGDLIKRVAAVVGGGGGGRPDMAQAGGKDPDKLSEALDQVSVYIRENLK